MLFIDGRGTSVAGPSGTLQRIVLPYTADYNVVVRGAGGSIGTTYNATTKLRYTGKPGRGAILSATIRLEAGTELLIAVGQCGTHQSTDTVSDGTSGGSGGATFVFRKIPAITDSTCQIQIDGEYWECLYVAAGGSGVQDGAYKKTVVDAPDASTTVYSKSKYKAFSTTTADNTASKSVSGTLSLAQIKANGFNGAFYSRGSNYGYGGFGCGSAADDNASYGGGWCNGEVSYQAANWALNGAECIISEGISDGAFSISAIIDSIEYIEKINVKSVKLSPNPVGTGQIYTITAVVEQERAYATAEFETPFSNESLDKNLISIGSF